MGKAQVSNRERNAFLISFGELKVCVEASVRIVIYEGRSRVFLSYLRPAQILWKKVPWRVKVPFMAGARFKGNREQGIVKVVFF